MKAIKNSENLSKDDQERLEMICLRLIQKVNVTAVHPAWGRVNIVGIHVPGININTHYIWEIQTESKVTTCLITELSEYHFGGAYIPQGGDNQTKSPGNSIIN